jgi:hypothetical protein
MSTGIFSCSLAVGSVSGLPVIQAQSPKVVREKVVKLAAELQQKGKSVAEAEPTNVQFSVVVGLNGDLCNSSRWNSLHPRAGGQNRCTMLPVFEAKGNVSRDHPDHARALSLSERRFAGVFDHSPDQNLWSCDGRGQGCHGGRPFYRPIVSVPSNAARSGSGCGRRQTRIVSDREEDSRE